MIFRRARRRVAEPAVLFDRAADRTLAADGFVVIDLLDAGDLVQLRQAWQEFDAVHPPVWDPTGFATTIRHPGIDARADEAIRPLVASRLGEVTDLVPFISGFLVKRPSSDTLPAHIDWTMVDASINTFGCWVPFEDTSPAAGALGVVPGSHALVDFDRSPEEPGHEWAAALLESGAEQRLLTLRAGQAVVFDHRLVHFSAPNTAEVSRVAINSGLCPAPYVDHARQRLADMMARGMAGAGGGPQIPD